jgi:hypothetical protein
MTTNSVTAHRNADKTTRSRGRAVLGRSVLVASLAAALAGSGDSDKAKQDRYVQLALAAEAVLSCNMLGQAAPPELLRELRGDAPAPDADTRR